MKKLFALFLALLMLSGICAVGAAAQETDAETPAEALVVNELPPGESTVDPSLGAEIASQAEEKKLVAPKKSYTIKTGEDLYFKDLLEGTTWELWELDVKLDVYGFVSRFYEEREDGQSYCAGVIADYPGKATITITAPDGKQVKISVYVSYPMWQWIKRYILFEWLSDAFPLDWPWVLIFIPVLPLSLLVFLFEWPF